MRRQRAGPRGARWRRVRLEALKRDGYRCRVCGEPDKRIGGRVSLHVDHIHEYADGGDLHSLKNLVSLCPRDHRLKSDRSAKAMGRPHSGTRGGVKG